MSSYRDRPELDFRVSNELAQRYLRTYTGVTLKPSTASTYDSHLTEYTSFLHNGDKTVLSAEFNDVLSFIEMCVYRGNRKSTVSGKLSTVAELYRFIRLRTDSREELEFDPLRFREIDLDRYNTPEPVQREALSRGEIRRLFDAFDSYRNRLMAIVGVETGLRNSDIRNLRLQDIHSDKIHVHDPKNSRPYDVPISDQLSFEFDRWCDQQRSGFGSAESSEYVFPSQTGEKLEQNGSFNQIIKEAADRAGIQDVIGRSPITDQERQTLQTEKEYREWHRVTAHTLRHSCITLLEEAGVGLSYRQLVANHSAAKTTMAYSHGGNNEFDEIRARYDPPR